MNEHRTTERDHWDIYADMDLTIEGHRLIAQEIGYEVTLAWRVVVGWLQALTGRTSESGGQAG